MYEGAPFRLTSLMSRNRIEEILGSIAYTSNNPPELLDKFWEVRQLIGEWNENMKKISSQVGSMRSMSQCQSGSMSTHVLASCVFQGSLGSLGMKKRDKRKKELC